MNFPVFAAIATVFFYPHIFTRSVGRRILLVVPVDALYRTSIISSSTVLPLNPFVNLSLAPLSLFLVYGPDIGVWPNCWVSAEFLCALIPRKGRVVPPPPLTLASRVFCLAIFRLKSAKFQTFVYNSRTVRSSFMKFGQLFEIGNMSVCTEFRGNRSYDFGFRVRKIRLKSNLFHPYQPTFVLNEFFFFKSCTMFFYTAKH